MASTSTVAAAQTQAGAEHQQEAVTADDNNLSATATEESIVVDIVTAAADTPMECFAVSPGHAPSAPSASAPSEAWSPAGEGRRGSGGGGGALDSIIEVTSLPGSTYECDEGGVAGGGGGGGERGVGRAPHDVFTQARPPAAKAAAALVKVCTNF